MKNSKKLKAFYIFPILYVVSAYLLLILFFEADQGILPSYLAYSPLVFGILNIIVCAKCCKPEYRNILLNSAILIKCSMIPFFVIGGILVICSLMLTLIPIPFMIVFGPTMALVCCVIGWGIVAFEAPYVISYLCLSQRSGFRSKSKAILHSICQFFFCLDVFDIIYLAIKERKWKKLQTGSETM